MGVSEDGVHPPKKGVCLGKIMILPWTLVVFPTCSVKVISAHGMLRTLNPHEIPCSPHGIPKIIWPHECFDASIMFYQFDGMFINVMVFHGMSWYFSPCFMVFHGESVTILHLVRDFQVTGGGQPLAEHGPPGRPVVGLLVA